MSRGMRLSVLGLYKADSGLFSEMVYPSGFTADEQQTTVGNILADKLVRRLVDLDAEIEKHIGCTIAEFFKTH